MTRAGQALALVLVFAACGGGGGDEPIVLLPAIYTEYVEVRGCRRSADHDLTSVRILASPEAADAYLLRDRPFPVGSVLIKEERDYEDEDCSDPIEGWTVMVQLASGTAPAALDWEWQRLDSARNIATEDDARCISCHSGCGVSPDGYLGTCAVP